jgi:hypothetical protein
MSFGMCKASKRPLTLADLLTMVVVSVVGVLFASAPESAYGQNVIDELSVQGASADGGDARTIRGRFGEHTKFSVTGRARDVVVLFDAAGYPLEAYELGELANNPGVIRTRPSVRLPDGRTRCWPEIHKSSNSILNGGYVGLFSSNGTLIDFDQIILR